MARKTRQKTESPRRGASATRARRDAPLRWYWRCSLVLVLIGLAALVWMSLLTYCPEDLPAQPAGEQPPQPLTASTT